MSVAVAEAGRGAALPAQYVEPVAAIEAMGFRAFTTTRAFGTFGTGGSDPVGEVMERWQRLRDALGAARFATARQVHGAEVLEHGDAWRGWLRGPDADGHLASARGTAMAVTIADCVPVFVAHPSGAAAVLHSGWRGTEAGITSVAVARLSALGFPARELVVATGPAICGRCYEVSPEVYARLTGRRVEVATPVDLRSLIAAQARAAGVRRVESVEACTRCDNARFFSHRAGDAGRQLGVLLAPA